LELGLAERLAYPQMNLNRPFSSVLPAKPRGSEKLLGLLLKLRR
jgi:hypothetical protein